MKAMRASISFNTIEPFVRRAYESDPELIEKWHIIAGSGLDQCVDRTVEDLLNCETITFYVVTEDGEFVGYFGSEYGGHYMPTIFILPKFRHRKAAFWKEIEATMASTWNAGVYAKNTRCISFYKKMGTEMTTIDTPHGAAVVFEFRKAG